MRGPKAHSSRFREPSLPVGTRVLTYMVTFFLKLCPRSASLQSYALLALSRARLITTIKCQASTSSTAMSATEPCAEILSDIALPKHELLEIHRSRISLHYAKAGYLYPTIRLPHTFVKLAGLSARIYQTIYDESLASLHGSIAHRKCAQKAA